MTYLIMFWLSLSNTELLKSTGSICLAARKVSPAPVAAVLLALLVEKSTGRDSSNNIPKEMSTMEERNCGVRQRAYCYPRQVAHARVPLRTTAGE
jgi:hypothetical protein